MNDALKAELSAQMVIARTAYLRFTASQDLFSRRGLSASDIIKVRAISQEAFEALTVSLGRIHEIQGSLCLPQADEPQRQRAHRYSSDARRHASLGSP